MKKLIFVAFLLLGITLIYAQTDVSGDVSGNWTLANSPYNVTGDITLQQGNLLTIEPGVQVVFQDHYKFDVFGRLLAIGNDTNHILFTANDQSTGWGGIRFTNINTNGQDTTMVYYCDFKYGNANGNDSSGGAIYLKNSDVDFFHINVSENQALGYGGGIYIEESSPILHYVEVFNNTATFDGGGIYCGFNSHPDFYRVAVAHNSTGWDGGGIAFFNQSDADLVNVTIADNHANQNGQGISINYQTSINIINSIFWNNGYAEIYARSSSYVNATYSDIDGGTDQPYFGDGCINVNPLFVDEANNDYNLNGHSPCINTGSPDDAYQDPDGTHSDMGAYYFAISGIMGDVRINLAGNDNTTTFADVTVILSGDEDSTTTPNEDGIYYFQLDPGDYFVTAELDNYFLTPVDPIPVHVTAGHLTQVSQTLIFSPPQPGLVWGIVTLTGIGNIPSIDINIDGTHTNPYPIYYDDGHVNYYRYRVLVPSAPHHRLEAYLQGYQEFIVPDFAVLPSDSVQIDITMTPQVYTGTVTGLLRLKGADGTGTGPGNVTDAIISDGTHSTHPDANGHYTLTAFSGNIPITASLSHYNTITLDTPVFPNSTTQNVNFTLLNWEPVVGNQYTMTAYSTISYDGDFSVGDSCNAVAIFGPGGYSDCRAIGTWIEGDHPLWDPQVNYYDIPGYWYITATSNVQGDPYQPANCEQLTVRFYNSETDSVYTCDSTMPFVDGFNKAFNFHIPSPGTTQEFSLINQWNWISFNLIPQNNSVSSIFAPLTPNNISEVKWEGEDAQYWNPNWVGGLSTIDLNEGLKVYMNNSVPFTFNGQKINSIIHPIYCHADTTHIFNYNWVAYYPYDPLPLNVALASLGASVTAVKAQNKSAVQVGNGHWVGDLTEMQPGQSYLLDINQQGAVLHYPTYRYYENAIVKNTLQNIVNNPANWKLITGNNTNMIFMAKIDADDSRYATGIFDENGNCRAIGKFTDDMWYFTVLGDDENELYVKIYDKETGKTITTDYTFTYEANTVLGNPDKPIKVKFEGETPQNLTTSLLKGNFPNPFNPTTEIKFSIPETGKVNLSVYNLKGELVQTLVNENLTKGEHTVNWNATKYGSGIYFYKIRYNGKSELHKCIMLK